MVVMEGIKTEYILPGLMEETEDFAADVKLEPFDTEEIELDNMLMDVNDIKTEENSSYEIVVEDGILDFKDEACSAEKKIPESEPREHHVLDKAEDRSQSNLLSKQNYKTIEEINTNFTRRLKHSYLLPVIREENNLNEIPVKEVTFSTFGQTFQEEVDKSKIRIVEKSLKRKSNDESSLHSQSKHEEHRNEYSSKQKTDLSIVEEIYLNEKLFKCTKCDYSSFQRGVVAAHVRMVHIKDKLFQCTDCEYTSSNRSSLVRHIKAIHLKVKPFKCTECSSCFSQKHKLTMHKRIVHENDPPFFCAECDCSFSCQSYFTKHNQEVHLKEKPFKCNECTYSSSRKSDLTTHIQSVHLKEKLFRCSECTYSCCQKSILTVHLRSVHLKEKPFSCTECKYSCSRKSCLAIHIRSVHKKERPFSCTGCGLSFIRKSQLAKHDRLMHENIAIVLSSKS